MQATGRDLMVEIGYALFHVEATVQQLPNSGTSPSTSQSSSTTMFGLGNKIKSIGKKMEVYLDTIIIMNDVEKCLEVFSALSQKILDLALNVVGKVEFSHLFKLKTIWLYQTFE